MHFLMAVPISKNFNNNEITSDISLPTVHFTTEQRLLLPNLKMLIAVRNGDFTLPYLTTYEIDCLITDIATM